MPSTPELRRTSLSLPWLTSWHVSPGLCFPAATTTGPSPRNSAEKTPAAWKRYALPLSRTATATKVSHRSLHRSSKDERTVTTACLLPGTENGLQRPTDLEGQTLAQLIMARRADLHSKAEYICADLSSRPNYPSQSCGGPYILGMSPVHRRVGPDCSFSCIRFFRTFGSFWRICEGIGVILLIIWVLAHFW